MNRNNIWIHIGIAAVLITMAAVLGQIQRWKSSLGDRMGKTTVAVSKPHSSKRTLAQSEPEVLVKFRPGVNLADVRKIAAKNNDRVEDNLEIVKGLISIDDLDNADPEKVAAQYSDMTDLVVYAEPNFEIRLVDPPAAASPRDLV